MQEQILIKFTVSTWRLVGGRQENWSIHQTTNIHSSSTNMYSHTTVT